MQARMRVLPWLFCVTALALGCSQGASDPNRPKTYPVTGTVTMGGAPVDGANVIFQLSDGSRSSSGVTDASGNYTLSTFASEDGALPGEYRVAVTKYEKEAAASGQFDESTYTEPDPNAPSTGPKNLLPAKYANAQSSGLTATVKEESNTIDLTLEAGGEAAPQ